MRPFSNCAHQCVVAVVHQRRDDDLVDRREWDRIDRRALGGTWSRRSRLGEGAVAYAHELMIYLAGTEGKDQ